MLSREQTWVRFPVSPQTFGSNTRKSLYGLKQAGRKWYDTLCHTLADLGFEVNDADPGVSYYAP